MNGLVLAQEVYTKNASKKGLLVQVINSDKVRTFTMHVGHESKMQVLKDSLIQKGVTGKYNLKWSPDIQVSIKEYERLIQMEG